jgi:hypothetical protein
MKILICGLIALAACAQTVVTVPPIQINVPTPAIDYLKVKDALKFRTGFETRPDGVFVDLSTTVKVLTYFSEPAIVPGACRIGTDGVLAANTMVLTPTHMYVCKPLATTGFGWARLPLQTKW